MEFYDFPIKFIYIPSGIIKEGLVVDCNECLENLTKNTEDDNDENKWCQSCQTNYFVKNFKNWTSENVKIDDYIRQKQLEKINDPKYTTFEWILHYDFGKTEKMENYDESCTLYSSIWRDGPLYYDFNKKIYRRKSNRKVVIKVIKSTNSLSATEFIKEIEKHDSFRIGRKIIAITQHPYTKEMSIKDLENKFISEDKTINKLIQEIRSRQIKVDDNIFEWIPYDHLNITRKLGNGPTTLYLATWIDGPLSYHSGKKKLIRKSPNKGVALKYVYNSQNINEEVLDELMEYHSINSDRDGHDHKIYGISQDPDTKDYIMVLDHFDHLYYCEKCGYSEIFKRYYVWYGHCIPCKLDNLQNNFTNWTSGNEEIDYFIQKMQLQISNGDIIFEWIPYDQLSDIKETETDAVYSAIWIDGPSYCKKEQTRESNKKVTLKVHDSQDITELLKNIDSSQIENHSSCKIYGISQNPNSKNYIRIVEFERCEKCDEKYIDDNHIHYKWCKPCQISSLNKNWTSGNKRIDNLIQEMRSNIGGYYYVIFEWIPYDQFSNIEKIGQGGFSTVYSAIWNDDNSQNIPDKFLNEIKKYSTKTRTYQGNILEMFGISQDPNTKNYIMVLKYAEGGDLNNWMTNYYKDIEWREKMKAINKIIRGISHLHNKNIVHRDLHTGNILATGHLVSFDLFISDFGLCGDINDMNEKHMYGVMSYMAPEVLRGKPYTKAADMYSFGMIMYFIATGRQPFADHIHDKCLILNICRGMRPKIEEWEAPKEYIDIMKSCWDSNPDNRPIAFLIALDTNTEYHERRRAFFKDFDEGYYKENIFKNFKSNQSTITPKSQLLTFTDDLDDLDTVIDDDQKNSV
ncbi:unnamed protein product [Rhizophagus irregularis]|nr:unnamed protein product [Rhizophagus irregularis]